VKEMATVAILARVIQAQEIPQMELTLVLETLLGMALERIPATQEQGTLVLILAPTQELIRARGMLVQTPVLTLLNQVQLRRFQQSQLS